jgi:hypothetical protein
MDTMAPNQASVSEEDWIARERYWRRKLGRIRLGAEPIEEQLAKYRRVTWMLTAVPLGLALMFVSLFWAFRRPDVGLILAGVLLLPIVAWAWIDFGLLRARAKRYAREYGEYQRQRAASGRD